MKLYDTQMAPNPRRARIFIAEKGLDIPRQEVSIIEGDNLKPEYLAVNPWGTLPALELDDGNVITEAPCIMRYLEALHPEPNLLGRDPLEAARIEAWERFCEMNGMQAVGEFFRNKFEPFAERAMPGYSGVKTIPALVERGKQRVAFFHAQLEKRLAESEYLGGDRFTAADITGLCAVDFGKGVGLPFPEGNQATARWHAAVSARPSAAN
ncbi:MAG: glutathione S-transferase family protein [Gammaproteobacteria bacterium]|nr:glutathione S-transferase family protein [Gammaproteobacteria bacterium]MCP5201288.1 glutathione S-transferase family protein [Gammaproteobacteria bacterium]